MIGQKVRKNSTAKVKRDNYLLGVVSGALRGNGAMRTSTWAQIIAAVIAQVFSVLTLILVLIWAGKSETDQVP